MKHRTLALITISFATLALTACAGGSPALSLEQKEVDLGEVVNGEVVEIELPIRNTGDGDLVIEAVSTSCGCTSAEVRPTIVAPGNEGVLHIEYDSGAHGPDETGPIMRQIFIASNDPDQPEAEVRITAEVLPPES